MKHTSRLFLLGCCAVSLSAGTVLSIQPAVISAGTPSTANVFDVLLTNTGVSSITVGGFSFEVSVTDPDITLTGADFATLLAPYIFAGQSLDIDFSIPLNGSHGATLDAGDVSDGTGAVIAAGKTLALGEVFFDVAKNAALGQFAVTFTGGSNGNSVFDVAGAPIAIDDKTPGAINIAVPEPSSALLALAALSGIAGMFRRRR